MPDIERLGQLKEILSSKLIRKRKAGIDMAGEMLANDIHRDQVRALLVVIAQKDSMLTLREAAQATLDGDEARHNPPAPDYVFDARCPKGHVNSYDKREYCGRQGKVLRRTVSRDGKDLDEVLLKCKTKACGEKFFVEVNCEGYK